MCMGAFVGFPAVGFLFNWIKPIATQSITVNSLRKEFLSKGLMFSLAGSVDSVNCLFRLRLTP